MLQLCLVCSSCTWYDTAVSGIFQLYLVHLICTCWYATTIQGMLQLFQVNSSCTWYTSSVLGMLQLYQVCSCCTWYASNYNRTFLALMSQAPPSSKSWLVAQTLLLHVRSNSQKETQPNNFNSSTSTSKSRQKFTIPI